MLSIRRTLSLPLLIGVPLLVLAAGGLCSTLVARRVYADFDAALLQRAQSLAGLLKMSNSGGALEFDFSDELMPEFSSVTQPEYFELWIVGGRLIERSRSLKHRHLSRPAERERLPSIRDYELPNGQPGRLVTIAFTPESSDAPTILGGDTAAMRRIESLEQNTPHVGPAIRLVLARSTIDSDRLVAEVTGLYLGVALLLAAAIVALLRLAFRRALAPLNELARQVAAIGTCSLDERIRLNPEVQELLPIVGRTNELLEALGSALVRERDFSANIAHELRTPVAELKCLAEVGLLKPLGDAFAHDCLLDALNIAVEMEQMVEQLLQLASLEAGSTPIEKRLMDLDALVAELWGSIEAEAESRRIALAYDVQAGIQVFTDRRQFALILRNLLGNAVQHCPPGSEIAVHGRFATPKRWQLMVTNAAPQLERTDVVSMFDRYWRKDLARTVNGHAGLGLSLVRAVAQLLGLEVSAELSTTHRLTVSVMSKWAGDGDACQGAGMQC